MTTNTPLPCKTIATLLLALMVPAVAAASPGWMGVGVGEITPEKVTALKLKEERGVEILTVSPDSPAAQAGLKNQDVVLEYNGTRVDSVEQFQRMVRETPPGRLVRLLISRDGATRTVPLKLAEKRGAVYTFSPREFEFHMPRIEIPEIKINPEVSVLMRTSRLGIDGQQLSKQLGEFFGAPGAEGVLITSVESGSPADKAGLKAGDVIIKLDGEKVSGMRDLRNLLREKSAKSSLPLVIIRNKREMTVTANIERRERGDREIDKLFEKIVVLSGGERLYRFSLRCADHFHFGGGYGQLDEAAGIVGPDLNLQLIGAHHQFAQ